MDYMNPGQYYKERLEELKKTLSRLLLKNKSLGWIRLGTLIAYLLGLYILWSLSIWLIVTVTLVMLFLFTRLILDDIKNKAAIKHLNHLVSINNDELKALDYNYYHFPNGSAFENKDHYYANDLDIFGTASVFQYINRTTSDMGSDILSSWLLSPTDRDTILQRQLAVKELKDHRKWQQELQAFGTERPIRSSVRKKLEQWGANVEVFSTFKPWYWLRYLLPAIILSVFTLTVFSILSLNILYCFLFFYAILAYQINKKVAPIHNSLTKIVEELEVLTTSMSLIENNTFNASLLILMQGQFKHGNKYTASGQFNKLKKILERLDLRYNLLISAPLNLLLLWNLQQVLDLEKWKSNNKTRLSQWFEALGQFESLNSLSVLSFNHPEWCFPVLREPFFYIKASNVGHPLINKNKRVNNSIEINEKGELMLITGSNMAGKSTYLRSIGINVILAMAGSAVCAESFSLSPVQLITSMRISDNLEESTSTFYAELKKLKIIIDKVNAGEHVFILLDEILRGTNSLDRHTGSVALIKQLIKHEAAGIIATHDIALAELNEDYPANILNFHFDVQVKGEELYFDYELKPGVCTSLNASILMKKIGIEL